MAPSIDLIFLPSPQAFHRQVWEQEDGKESRFQMGDAESRVGLGGIEMGWEWDGDGIGGSRGERVRAGWDQEKPGGTRREREGAAGSKMGVGVIG